MIEARARVERWLAAMWQALDAERATERALGIRSFARPPTVFAIGKAAEAMARATLPLGATGLAFAPHAISLPGFRSVVGGHPLPAEDAPVGGRAALELARSLGAEDHALCVISGGGSALLELPVEGVSIDLVREVTRTLMAAGVDIETLNAARVGLSALKGGRLAAAIAPARCTTLLVHDVPGHPAHVIASGPTLPSPVRTPPEALPASARAQWQAPPAELPSGDVEVVLQNGDAVEALRDAAWRQDGLRLGVRPRVLAGEARDAGVAFVRACRAGAWREGYDGYVAGGETTVERTGASGKGGRAHEFVLGAAHELREGELLVCVGTDGLDGNSDAAGALSLGPRDDPTLRRALTEHDTATYAAAHDLQLRGPRTTNVADVALFLSGST